MKRIFTITLITLLISSCTFGQEVKKPIFKKVNLGGGDYYEGYMLNGKKEGKGKLFIKNDGIFEGAFKNDKFHGFGKWTMYDGEILEQEYKDDRTVGLVKRTKNGIVTYGNFENNEFVEDKTFAFKANPDLSTENKNEKITPKTPFKDFDVDKLIDELTAYNTKEDSLKKLFDCPFVVITL